MAEGSVERQYLRLLSYNIQSGLSTRNYSQYLTRGWCHIVPVPSRIDNLDGIAHILMDYDLVGLQEVDVGSLRTGFVNQPKYLAHYAGFPYVFEQSNRKIGVLSQHGNALLSRIRPEESTEHRLPGLPGRGVLKVRFGCDANALYVLVLHMALGRRSRLRQIGFTAELAQECPHLILMGDLNCRSDSREMSILLERTGLCTPAPGLHTFPSWRPNRQLDHILVSPSIQVEWVTVLHHPYSDHLPLAMGVRLPAGVQLSLPPPRKALYNPLPLWERSEEEDGDFHFAHSPLCLLGGGSH